MRREDIRRFCAVRPVEVEVLRGVLPEVRRGGLLSIMDPAGRGKSTFMNMPGLPDRPTGVRRFVEGREFVTMGG